MSVSAYVDWDSPTYDVTTQLSRLAMYMADLRTVAYGPNVGSDGKSVDNTAVLQQLKDLSAEREKLKKRVGRLAAGGFVIPVRFGEES